MGKTCRWKHLARVPPPVLHPGAAPHPGVLPLSLPPSPPSSHPLYTSPSFSPSLAPYRRLYLPPSTFLPPSLPLLLMCDLFGRLVLSSHMWSNKVKIQI